MKHNVVVKSGSNGSKPLEKSRNSSIIAKGNSLEAVKEAFVFQGVFSDRKGNGTVAGRETGSSSDSEETEKMESVAEQGSVHIVQMQGEGQGETEEKKEEHDDSEELDLFSSSSGNNLTAFINSFNTDETESESEQGSEQKSQMQVEVQSTKVERMEDEEDLAPSGIETAHLEASRTEKTKETESKSEQGSEQNKEKQVDTKIKEQKAKLEKELMEYFLMQRLPAIFNSTVRTKYADFDGIFRGSGLAMGNMESKYIVKCNGEIEGYRAGFGDEADIDDRTSKGKVNAKNFQNHGSDKAKQYADEGWGKDMPFWGNSIWFVSDKFLNGDDNQAEHKKDETKPNDKMKDDNDSVEHNKKIADRYSVSYAELFVMKLAEKNGGRIDSVSTAAKANSTPYKISFVKTGFKGFKLDNLSNDIATIVISELEKGGMEIDTEKLTSSISFQRELKNLLGIADNESALDALHRNNFYHYGAEGNDCAFSQAVFENPELEYEKLQMIEGNILKEFWDGL